MRAARREGGGTEHEHDGGGDGSVLAEAGCAEQV